QILQALRILALSDRDLILDAAVHAQVVVVVDGLGDAAQPVVQIDFLLAPEAETRHRQRERGENGDDRADRDQFRDRKTTLPPQMHHSTFVFPPATADITSTPFASRKAGFSITR